MSYDYKQPGVPISSLPTTLGEFGENCQFWDAPCHARNAQRAAQKLADDAADAVDRATGGAWSKTREAREGAAEAITSTVSNIQKSVSQAAQATQSATSGAVQSLKPKAMSAKDKREFDKNPVLYVVNKLTAPFAGWFVELMLRLVQRTGRRSVSQTLLTGQRVNIDLVPRPTDSLIQTSLKLVSWITCCTYAFNEEAARKVLGMPVGKKGFFGSYDLEVPGVAISSLPTGPSGAAFRFGESDFWTDGIGPTGAEEAALAAAKAAETEGYIIVLSKALITALVNMIPGMITAAAKGGKAAPVSPSDVGSSALAAQINEAINTLPDSDFQAGSGSQERSSINENFLPIAVGGAVGVSLLLLLLYKNKKK